jgi:hypothetical protein
LVLCCSIMCVLIFYGELNNQKRESRDSFFCVQNFVLHFSPQVLPLVFPEPATGLRCTLCTGIATITDNQRLMCFSSTLCHWANWSTAPEMISVVKFQYIFPDEFLNFFICVFTNSSTLKNPEPDEKKKIVLEQNFFCVEII